MTASQIRLEEALIEFLIHKNIVKHPWNKKHRRAYSLKRAAITFRVNESKLKTLLKKVRRRLVSLPATSYWQAGNDLGLCWPDDNNIWDQCYIHRYSTQIRATLNEMRLTEMWTNTISTTSSSAITRKMRF